MKIGLKILPFLLFIVISAFAQEANYDNRTALIIGNSTYENMPLKNPENDAKVISKTLSELGFDVLEYTNLDGKGMKMAIRTFSDKLKENPGVGLFYYAGHGIQADGVNYLVPINSNIQEQFEIEFECVEADRALAVMELSNNPFNIVILDACRNNPFRSFSRSAGDQGFVAPQNPPTGSIVAFATQPGKTASDGEGDNGLYTQELVKAIQTPGIPIEEVFKQVRINVSSISDQKQVPQEWSSLMGNFYFKSLPKDDPSSEEETNISSSQEINIDDTEPQMSLGVSKRMTGSINLVTLMTGVLYVDNMVQGDGKAIPMGYGTEIKDLTIGIHTIEVKGQTGSWKKEVMVRPDETVKIIAEITATSNSPNQNITNSRSTEEKVNLNSSSSEFNNTSNSIDVEKAAIPEKTNIPIVVDANIYESAQVDEIAQPVGGMNAFYSFVKKEIKYPRAALQKGIEGAIFVEFVVNSDGSLSDVKTLKGIGFGCNEEAERIIKIHPKWTPGILNGNPVNQKTVVVIKLKLQ